MLATIDVNQILSGVSTWVWIVLAILPSAITALAPYPKTDGILKTIQKILGFFSVLTHPDSPGTLKMPLTPTQPPSSAVK